LVDKHPGISIGMRTRLEKVIIKFTLSERNQLKGKNARENEKKHQQGRNRE